MKQLLCTILLFCGLSNLSYSQIIDGPIPKFSESFFSLNKNEVRIKIKNHGFKLLSSHELRSLGFDEENLSNLTVGIGDYKINCKVKTNSYDKVESVTVGGVRYLNARSMINEYTNNGYILDELKSTGNSLFFVKKLKNKTYVSLVDFMINPQMCMANSEFRLISN